MQKVDKKKKEKGKCFRKEQYTVLKNKSHMRIMAILCLHMKQDKGAYGYVGSAQVHLCKLHDQTFCKGYTPKYVYGIWTATVQGTQQEPLTLKDLTEMKGTTAWERHVKQPMVFR